MSTYDNSVGSVFSNTSQWHGSISVCALYTADEGSFTVFYVWASNIPAKDKPAEENSVVCDCTVIPQLSV